MYDSSLLLVTANHLKNFLIDDRSHKMIDGIRPSDLAITSSVLYHMATEAVLRGGQGATSPHESCASPLIKLVAR